MYALSLISYWNKLFLDFTALHAYIPYMRSQLHHKIYDFSLNFLIGCTINGQSSN
ncbi:hypothetical protein RhiirA4_114724 [Rhizophagus irregularis]|uniref:Uncharacterized protein n=1 Tax=Rhizophagus irregularis TaxID=588596 RepID=A0A2I1G9N5_9GLOM|nr:hypothetical protein RhiirA4_114724 [Rhizophagus irregularis]